MKEKRKGFTLVEIIIAVALLGVITVPIMSILVRTAQLNERARLKQKATDLGQNVMEGIRNYYMEDIAKQCLGGKLDFIESVYNMDSYDVVSDHLYDESDETKSVFLDSNQFLQQLYTKVNGHNADLDGNVFGEAKKEKYYSVGKDYHFAFCGIKYNKTIFDVLVTFEAPEVVDPDNMIYYIYGVTVTVYRSVPGAHFTDEARLAELTGAVQNKKPEPIVGSLLSAYFEPFSDL